jgi:hypothetical protein
MQAIGLGPGEVGEVGLGQAHRIDLDLNVTSVYSAMEDYFAVTLDGGRFQLDIGTLPHWCFAVSR